jgi:hypothetical protein
MCDGAVIFVSNTIARASWGAMFTRASADVAALDTRGQVTGGGSQTAESL